MDRLQQDGSGGLAADLPNAASAKPKPGQRPCTAVHGGLDFVFDPPPEPKQNCALLKDARVFPSP
jgi:hypothetical protein